MLATRVIPCLLLDDGGLVKTTKFDDARYVGDPINAVRIFNEKEVDELLFLDITATREGRPPPFDLIEQIASECFMPVCYGGGVRTTAQMRQLFALGVEKIAVNSAAIATPDLIDQAAELFGRQSVVVAIDVLRTTFGKLQLLANRTVQKMDPIAHAIDMQRRGAGEILLTAVHRDGTGKGYDCDLIAAVAAVTSIPIVACGGAGGLSHFREAVDHNASAVAAGSMFVFYGKHQAVLINYPTQDELREVLPVVG